MLPTSQMVNILEGLNDGIFIVDEQWCLTYVNRKMEEIWGLCQADLLGRNLWAVFPQSIGAPIYHIYLGAMQEQRSATFEYYSPVVKRWLAVHTYPNEAGLAAQVSDITHRKHAEAATAHLAALVESSEDAIISKNLQGIIISWNKGAEKIFGYTAAETVGQPITLLIPPQRIDEEPHILESIKRGETVEHYETVRRRKDGRDIAISLTVSPIRSEAGHIIGVSKIARDITEREQTDEALREQHQLLQLVIDSVPDLITVNDRTGHFHMVNASAAHIYGLTPAEMVGKTDAEVNPNPGEVAYFLQTDQVALDSEQTVFIPGQTIQGRYYQTSKIPLKKLVGKPDRLLAVSTDITKYKETEVALQQALKQEKELNELKSRFVSMASHEFRTPLMSILALTETLRAYRHKLSDQQITKRLDDIIEQVNYLKAIMEDVLQLTRIEAQRYELKLEQLDLVAFCQRVLNEFQSRPDVRHPIIFRSDVASAPLALDKSLMHQIISNLVANAIKYSPVDKPILVTLQMTSSSLILQVRDQGIGIPANDVKHLFQPFHRAANVGNIPGTGLGLVITKEAVAQQGGTITVESQVGGETIFTVKLPLADSKDKAVDKALEH